LGYQLSAGGKLRHDGTHHVCSKIHKQHHTAMRVYERLKEEHGYNGSYSVVQRCLKQCRSQQVEKANLELVWDPGQVDFGEADFYEDGKLSRKKIYLTLSFPYGNDGYSQIFGGGTAECVCQGLQDIFEYIGGVPPLLIFDNATGVGRRARDVIHESELFSRFRAITISGYASVIRIPERKRGTWSEKWAIIVPTYLCRLCIIRTLKSTTGSCSCGMRKRQGNCSREIGKLSSCCRLKDC